MECPPHDWHRREDVEKGISDAVYARHCGKCGRLEMKSRAMNPEIEDGWFFIAEVKHATVS